MERVALARVPIAQGKIDGHAQLNLTATKDILEEGVALVEDQVFKICALVSAAPLQVKLQLALAQLRNVTREVAQVDVPA